MDDAEITQIFMKLDTNGDGKIDADEFAKLDAVLDSQLEGEEGEESAAALFAQDSYIPSVSPNLGTICGHY